MADLNSYSIQSNNVEEDQMDQMDQKISKHKFLLCSDHSTFWDFRNRPKILPPNAFTFFDPKPDIEDDYQCDFISEDKYAFLSDNVDITSQQELDPEPSKETMLAVHKKITTNVIKLVKLLAKESCILRQLNASYTQGKFHKIASLLERLPEEFIKSQLESFKPPKEIKFTDKEMYVSLSLYNKNGKLYRYLSRYLYLPPVDVLKSRLSKIPFELGPNEEILNKTRNSIRKFQRIHKICVLLVGEVNLTSKPRNDSQEPVRVLVLMARGLHHNWKQVVSYHALSGPVTSEELKKIVTETISKLQEITLEVVGVVCERNKTHLEAFSLHLAQENIGSDLLDYFEVTGKRIYVVYDVPHLMKQTLDDLRRYQVLLDKEKGVTAKFEHVYEAYKMDDLRQFKALYKLQDRYFDFENQTEAEAIEAAIKILSQRVASVVYNLSSYKQLPEDAEGTAEFVLTFDVLFDSLNGVDKVPPDHRKFYCRVSRKTKHVEHWSSLLPKFEQWEFLDVKTGENVTNFYSSIHGWRSTIQAVLSIWKTMKTDRNILYLNLRMFNLDTLRELFKEITQYDTNGENLATSLKTAVYGEGYIYDGFNLLSIRDFA